MSLNIEDIEKKIDSIENKLKNVLGEVENLKEEIRIHSKQIIVKNRKDNRKKFAEYLKDIKLLSDRSIEGYIGALSQIKSLIYNELGITIDSELYEINDITTFNNIIDLFENNVELININLKRHHFYSATYHNYLDFLKYEVLINE